MAAAPTQAYSDGGPNHPALAARTPSQTTQQGMAALTQSNLPAMPTTPPAAAPAAKTPMTAGAASPVATPVAGAVPKPPSATSASTPPTTAPRTPMTAAVTPAAPPAAGAVSKPAIPPGIPKASAQLGDRRPHATRDWRRGLNNSNDARAAAPEPRAIPDAPAFRRSPAIPPTAFMRALQRLPQELRTIGLSALPRMLPLT